MDWTPAECTLPTEDRPLRVAEFDDLFASASRALERVGPTHLRLTLEAGRQIEETARELMARETNCCSFFDFTLTPAGEILTLDIHVPATHVTVLDGLASRAGGAAPQAVAGGAAPRVAS
ncbi:hypothetical protein [Sphaerisporangium corydalis]|uniref:Arsenate reductase n=1 Tax=Sphaerisporangium corydalis TaxID=1441875 RepID=A0ABV9EGF7_9ACTN|nr:hypothetical protein [Sphaerisporangium corydalis]